MIVRQLERASRTDSLNKRRYDCLKALIEAILGWLTDSPQFSLTNFKITRKFFLMRSDKHSPAPTSSSNGGEAQILSYFGFLTLLIYMSTPTGYLVDIATSFMLKNQLHASAEQVANFRFLTAIPAFVAFIFGIVRDRWNPFGLRDRGYFLIFAPMTGAVFVWLAFGKLQITSLTLGVILSVITFRFVTAAYQGLMSLIGQEKQMSGRLATIWNIALAIPALLAAYSSGWVTEHLKPREIFLIMAALCFALGIYGLWKQRTVFTHAYDQPRAQHLTLGADVKRLIAHRAIYGAILINFLWNFAPGASTPLQYYLTNQLHLPDAAFANYTAIFAASFIPTYIIYGYLCKRVPQSKLLLWGTVIGVPQMIPLLFVHSSAAAQLMAIPIGLMGGIASAAYFDLAMRSCPPGLQGTLMMFVDGMLILSSRGGDILGTKIYDSDKANGFLYCVIATTGVYALILPLLLLVPKNLVATRDGEDNPEIEKEVLEELTTP